MYFLYELPSLVVTEKCESSIWKGEVVRQIMVVASGFWRHLVYCITLFHLKKLHTARLDGRFFTKRLVKGLKIDNIFKNKGIFLKEVIKIPEFSEKYKANARLVLPYISISHKNVNTSNMAYSLRFSR